MNNQTIDGVPLNWAEIEAAVWGAFADGAKDYRGCTRERLRELRALVDAPTPTPVPAAWMRFNDDQKAIFTRGKRSNNSEPLYPHPTAYRVPAAQHQGDTPDDDKSHPRFIAGYTAGLHDHKLGQPQGEPAAYLDLEKIQPSEMAYATKVRVNHRQTALYAEQPTRVEITLQQVLTAYNYAEQHPHKYLRGTTNWCAAVAHSLNALKAAK